MNIDHGDSSRGTLIESLEDALSAEGAAGAIGAGAACTDGVTWAAAGAGCARTGGAAWAAGCATAGEAAAGATGRCWARTGEAAAMAAAATKFRTVLNIATLFLQLGGNCVSGWTDTGR
jgi:hypothetical protein